LRSTNQCRRCPRPPLAHQSGQGISEEADSDLSWDRLCAEALNAENHNEPPARKKFRFVRSFAFRLSLWYALIFSGSAICLAVVFYWLASIAIERNDREVVEAQWKAYAAVYNARGLEALRAYLAPIVNTSRESFYVRLVTSYGKNAIWSV